MHFLYFKFFEFFLFIRLIIETLSETNELNNGLSDGSKRIFNSSQENFALVNKNNKNYKLIESNPSISLLEEKIKISIGKNKLKSFEPSLTNFEKLVKTKNNYNYKSKAIIFKPSVNNSEMHEKTVKNDDKLSMNNLKNLVKVDFKNKYEKKRLKVFLPGYQGSHEEIIYNQQGYLHDNFRKEKRALKSADMKDYNRWLDVEGKSSRLERFKKLYEEFSKLNTQGYDHDFNVKYHSNTQIEKPLKKLKKTIEHIELEEQRKQLKQEL